MIVSFKKCLILILCSAFVGSLSKAASNASSSIDVTGFSTKLKTKSGYDLKVSTVEVQAPIDSISDLIDMQNSNADVLITTDSQDILQAASAAAQHKLHSSRLAVMPFGKLTGYKDKISQQIKNFTYPRATAFKTNTISILVTTFVYGNDSLIWLHSDVATNYQKSVMIAYNMVMWAVFGLKQNHWADTVAPVKHGLFRKLSRLSYFRKSEKTNYLTSQFFANLSLSFALQATRATLLSADHFSDSLQSAGFWMDSLALASVATYAQSAWVELSAKISLKKHPVSYHVLNRISDLRYLFLGYFATSAMVLQPEVYGYKPAVILFAHGTVGVFALLNAQAISDFIENSAFKLVQIKDRIFEYAPSFKYRSFRCERIFQL